MLDLLENLNSSTEIIYTYGRNAVNHAQGFFSFVGEGLSSVYECINNCVPDFLVPVLLLSIGVYVSSHFVRW